MRAINVLLAIGISIALGFFVFEFGLRQIPAYRPQAQINQFDPRLGWTKKPSFSAGRQTNEFDITFNINALGLRDDPMTNKEKAPNTFRVMLLGDSFVLGYTVDRKDLFVDQLEGWWKDEQRRVDVINAGTEGYSTDQEVAWFLEEGVGYEPDLVLIFPYENDIYWNGQTAYSDGSPKPRFTPGGELEQRKLNDPQKKTPFLNKWATGKFLLSLAQRLKKGPADLPHHFDTAGLAHPIPKEFAILLKEEPAFLGDCLARTRGALSALSTECERIGAELVVVPIPSESAVHPDQREAFRTNPFGLKGIEDALWSPDRPVQEFLAMSKELGIKTLDPRSTLKARGAEELLYFDAEWHFNARGNQVFTTYLHDELDSMGVFPAEFGAMGAPVAFRGAESEGGIPWWGFLYAGLWALLGTMYSLTYRDEPAPMGFLKVGAFLALVFTIVGTVLYLMGLFPGMRTILGVTFLVAILGFVAYKLGRRVGTVLELLQSFTLRGHWYLMPLVVVLLSIGSLLVVAASSPLIAPFIYTLF